MHAAPQSVDANALRSMASLRDLDDDQFRAVVARGQICTPVKGDVIFTLGQSDDRVIYLLAGDVTLVHADAIVETVRASSPRSRQPLAESLVRESTATAKTNCTLFWFAKTELPAVSAGDELVATSSPPPSASPQGTATPDSLNARDWFGVLMRGPAFARLSAQHIESLSARIETVPVKVGQVIIKQGAAANNYYFIRSGKFQILRRIDGAEYPLELAILSSGSGFGEEALITNGRRNASVIAIEDGELYRLSKHNFTTLLAKPLTQKVSLEQAQQLVRRGAAFFDVRAAEDFKRNGLTQALNIPLSLLRANLTSLSPDREYIAYCNTGVISAVACFVLLHNGFRAFTLSGGLDGLSATEDHLVGRVTRETQRKAGASMIDVKKVARRLASVPTPIKAPGALGAIKSAPANEQHLATIAEPAMTQKRDDAVDELAKLKAKLNTLVNDEPTRSVQLPPVAESVSVKASSSAAVSMADIRNDDQLWTKIPDSVSATGGTAAVSATPRAPGPQPNAGDGDPIHLSWINDQTLWDTVVGYRSDPRVEALLMAESRRSNEPASAPVVKPALTLRSTESATSPAPRVTNRADVRKGRSSQASQLRTSRPAGKWVMWAAFTVVAFGAALWLLGKTDHRFGLLQNVMRTLTTSDIPGSTAQRRHDRIVDGAKTPVPTPSAKKLDAGKRISPDREIRPAADVKGVGMDTSNLSTVHTAANQSRVVEPEKVTATPTAAREHATVDVNSPTPRNTVSAGGTNRSGVTPSGVAPLPPSVQNDPPAASESARVEPPVRGDESIPVSNLTGVNPVPDEDVGLEQTSNPIVVESAPATDVDPAGEARDATPEVASESGPIQSSIEQVIDAQPEESIVLEPGSESNPPIASGESQSTDSNRHVQTP